MVEFSPSIRRHGAGPPDIIVVHGGPGAAGELEPLAQLLARGGYSVWEPFQTASSMAGQISELVEVLRHCPTPPAVLGWSWGAWLALWCALDAPDLISQLILVGSGPFDAETAKSIRPTRMSRLTLDERDRLQSLSSRMDEPAAMAEALELFDTCDCYARDDSPQPLVQFDRKIHQNVWHEAAVHRKSGALLRDLERLRTATHVIHGDHDPHPFEGVQAPLKAKSNTTFHLLERCGHKPWQEVHAKDKFLSLLDHYLSAPPQPSNMG